MRLHNFPDSYRLKPLSTAVALAVTASLTAIPSVYAQESTVEEVIVTGSFIRRSEGFTAASPIVQISADDLANQGTFNMGEVVANMTIVNGEEVSAALTASNATSGFNLRGLGNGATLTLVDSKRVGTSNVQRLLPSAFIERIDIVTDGAAALYGTDAVAGVVNLIPYTSYDGVKLEVFDERDDQSSYWSRSVSLMAGRTFGNVDLVVGLSHSSIDALESPDRPKYVPAGFSWAGDGGHFDVPTRDADGNLTGEIAGGQPDRNCGLVTDTDQSAVGNNPYGQIWPINGQCWISFGETFDFMIPTESSSVFSNMTWEYSEDLSFNAQVLFNRQRTDTLYGPSVQGDRESLYPTVRGELPGNTFRATNSDGAPLYAVPLYDGSGAIVRDTYGNAQWQRGADGSALLAANRYADITADPTGGVPFYEDVQIAENGWIPFNKVGTNTHPAAFDRNGTAPIIGDDRQFRVAFGADFTVPVLADWMEGWEGSADYTYSGTNNRGKDTLDQSLSAIQNGLNCDILGAPETCYNPFMATDPRYFNSQEVVEGIYTDYRNDHQTYLQTFDLVFNGNLPITLAGGDVGAAFGYQRRIEDIKIRPNAGDLAGDSTRGQGREYPYDLGRHSDSWFAEFAIPVLDNLEISASVRNEDFSSGQAETIGKFGVVYQPTDWLSLRATAGESFIVPGLNALAAPENCNVSQFTDLYKGEAAFISSCGGSNPDLQPESSDSISAGFDLNFANGLSASVSWSETDFVDRITAGQTLLEISQADAAAFEAAGLGYSQAAGFPTLEQLTTWANDPRSDRRIIRDPSNPFTVVRIEGLGDQNAAENLVRAIDLRVRYGFALSDVGLPAWGNITMGLEATYLETWEISSALNDVVIDALGSLNNSVGAAPALPEWRANFQLGWNSGPHSIVTTTRYVDEVDLDITLDNAIFNVFFPGSTWRPRDVLPAWTQLDVAYNYHGLELLGGDIDFTLGARNATDREANRTGGYQGYTPQMQNVMGRLFYGRVNYNF